MCRDDRECIERCLNGHPDDYRHLVRRYQRMVLGYLSGRLGNRSQAEEAAQEAFVRAYFGLGKLRKPARFPSWLLGIATRVVRESQRAAQRDRRAAEGAAEIAARNGRTDAARDEAATDVAIRRAVAALPRSHREIILLRYYGDLSCRQMAERLDKPVGTVTKMLSRAYATLRQTLGETGQYRVPEEKEAGR